MPLSLVDDVEGGRQGGAEHGGGQDERHQPERDLTGNGQPFARGGQRMIQAVDAGLVGCSPRSSGGYRLGRHFAGQRGLFAGTTHHRLLVSCESAEFRPYHFTIAHSRGPVCPAGGQPRYRLAGTGSSQDTVVPWPAVLCTENVPPSASIRSFSPTSPEPRSGSAPPAPSSRTRTRSLPPETAASTSTTEACACLVALVSASEQTQYAATSTGSGSRPSVATSSWTAIAARRPSVRRAGPSPPSDKIAGWMPRAISRRSSTTPFSSSATRPIFVPSPGSPAGTRDCAKRSSRPRETRRCWVPSCRSRSIRRLVSSAAATIRAREAASSVRLSALLTAVATSSVKSAIRSMVLAGNGSRVVNTVTTPHRRPSTTIGLATTDRIPSVRRPSATRSGTLFHSSSSTRAGRPVRHTAAGGR